MDVYCIDDTAIKHEQYFALARECNDAQLRGRLRFNWLQHDRPEWGLENFAENSVTAKFIFEVSTKITPAIILLDLEGVSSDNKRVEIDNLLDQHCANQGPDSPFQRLREKVKNYGGDNHPIKSDHRYLPVFVCEAARIFNHTVFMFSTEGRLGEIGDFIEEYKVQSIIEGSRGGFLNIAKRKVLSIMQSPIERIIDIFLRELNDNKYAWSHDMLETGTWRQKAQKALGVEEELQEDDAKALFCLESERSFSPFILPSDKKLTTATLRSVLQAMEFPCDPTFSPESAREFKLPLQPGIVFLIGLRQMLDCVKELEPKTDGQKCSLLFEKLSGGGPNNHGEVWCARIVFNKPYSQSVDHIFRYRERALDRPQAVQPGNQAQGRLTTAADRVARGQVDIQALRLDANLMRQPVAISLQNGPTVRGVDATVIRIEPVSVATLSLNPGEIRFYWK
jgi:hypothetical protein